MILCLYLLHRSPAVARSRRAYDRRRLMHAYFQTQKRSTIEDCIRCLPTSREYVFDEESR